MTPLNIIGVSKNYETLINEFVSTVMRVVSAHYATPVF